MHNNSWCYTKEDLIQAMRDIGLKKCDVVFSHSNIAYCGLMAGCNTHEEIAESFLEAFFEVIGEEGTLIVPTFTYSTSNGRIFDYENSHSDCGFFTEYIRKHPHAIRSLDPNVSVAAIGAKADILLRDLSVNGYDDESFFGRFYNDNGVICNINFDAASTFVHYVERCLSVPYRFDKVFNGIMRIGGIEKACTSVLWVRKLQDGTQLDTALFHKVAVDKGLYKMSSVGRGSIGLIKSSDVYEIIEEGLRSNPNFLIKANWM